MKGTFFLILIKYYVDINTCTCPYLLDLKRKGGFPACVDTVATKYKTSLVPHSNIQTTHIVQFHKEKWVQNDDVISCIKFLYSSVTDCSNFTYQITFLEGDLKNILRKKKKHLRKGIEDTRKRKMKECIGNSPTLETVRHSGH